MRLFLHKKRPVHLGPYPLERLPRLADPASPPRGLDLGLPARPDEAHTEGPAGVGHAYRTYEELYDRFRDGEVSPPAPFPDDPDEVAANV